MNKLLLFLIVAVGVLGKKQLTDVRDDDSV